ncbi:PhnD/SsuA/transferrin family substrate-binding protein, partial [Candidatus Riflebacteria bacterium]
MRKLLLFLFFIFLSPILSFSMIKSKRKELIFAVISFRDYKSQKNPREILLEYLRHKKIPVYPKVVTGTYDDIYYWLKTRQIDLALITPGIFIGLKNSLVNLDLLAQIQGMSPENKLVSFYRSLILVRTNSNIRTIDQLHGRKLLFVNEFSMSGFLVPAAFLSKKGISPVYNYSYMDSHSNAMRGLLNSKGDAAFVYENYFEKLSAEDKKQVRPLSFILDKNEKPFLYPNDYFVAGKHVAPDLRQKLKSALFTLNQEKDWVVRLAKNNSYIRGFEEASTERTKELKEFLGEFVPPPSNRYNVSKMVEKIKRSIRQQEKVAATRGEVFQPKIAVVLSGGGAKNSFQVGILQALERKIKDEGLKIDYMIGTSVGAFNALCSAIGEIHNLKQFWQGLGLEHVWQDPPTDLMPFQWRIKLMRFMQIYPQGFFFAFLFLCFLGILNHFFILSVIFRNLHISATKVTIAGLVLMVFFFFQFPRILTLIVSPILGIYLIFYACYRFILDRKLLSRNSWVRNGFLFINFLIMFGVFWLFILLVNLVFIDQAFVSGYPFESYIGNILKFKIEKGGKGKFKPPDKLLSKKELAEICQKILNHKFFVKNYIISATNFNRQKEMFFYYAVDKDVEEKCKSLGWSSLKEDCLSPLTSVMAASAAFFPFMNHQEIKMKSPLLTSINLLPFS